jgi:hypothetical protein
MIMAYDGNEPHSDPREVRVGRLNRKPGPNKALISLAVLVALIVLFILVFYFSRF